MEDAIDLRLSLSGMLLRYHLCGNDLKGERDRGEQREESVDDGRMAESSWGRGTTRQRCCMPG